MLNYSVPHQPLLLHHSSSFPLLLFFSTPLAAILLFLPLSLSLLCASLLYASQNPDSTHAYVPPPRMSIKPICFVATGYRRCLWPLLLNCSPSPYRVTCLLVKQSPPDISPHPHPQKGLAYDSPFSHAISGKLPFSIHACRDTNMTLPFISRLAVPMVCFAPLQHFMKDKHSKTKKTMTLFVLIYCTFK